MKKNNSILFYNKYAQFYKKYDILVKRGTVVAIPFTSNLVPSEYEPNILFKKEETGLSKDSVAVIHLIGAVNKFSFERKVSKLSEENYQKLVDAVIKLISDKK